MTKKSWRREAVDELMRGEKTAESRSRAYNELLALVVGASLADDEGNEVSE